MKRINVIGTTGSGKTTFARNLAEQLGYPCVHMDELFWRANWTESPDDEFFPRVADALSGNTWVLDGNYSRTSAIKWERVDTIIWLDFGFFRTLTQLVWRTIARACSRQELWPGTGNTESFSKSFLSRESIIVWFFRSYWKNRSRYSSLMQSEQLEHVRMYRLRSRNEAREFVRNSHNTHMQATA